MAAALQRKCYFRWIKHTTTFPNMYIVLVGPSGRCRKGTALAPGSYLLRQLGVKIAAEAITREALIRELRKAYDPGVNIVGKISPHASLTVFSKELTVFLGYNNVQLMSDMADWYDCDDQWTYRTKNSGEDEIKGVWVNLIGATTPELIQSAMPQDLVGGGLASRMIFVYEEKRGRITPERYVETKEDIERRRDLLHDLEDIYAMNGEFDCDQSFIEVWEPWYEAQEDRPRFSDPRLAGYNTRRGVHVLKLSMILNASREGKMVLTGEDIIRAIYTLEEAEHKMDKTFSGVGRNPTASIMARILATLIEHGTITVPDLYTTFSYDASRDEISEIISVLEYRGVAVMKHTDKGSFLLYTGKEKV